MTECNCHNSYQCDWCRDQAKAVGLCRGGPLDGQNLASTERIHRISIMQPIPEGMTFGDAEYVPVYLQEEYHYISGHWEYQG